MAQSEITVGKFVRLANVGEAVFGFSKTFLPSCNLPSNRFQETSREPLRFASNPALRLLGYQNVVLAAHEGTAVVVLRKKKGGPGRLQSQVPGQRPRQLWAAVGGTRA